MAERRTEVVMGMPVTVDVRDAAVPAAAVEEAFAWLREVDARFSTYRAGSEIRALGRGDVPPGDAHPDVQAVLARCEALREETGGYFDARAAGAGTVDPSGYVKGWAVDRAVAVLERRGLRDLCVEAGGDLAVRGVPAAGRRWRVGIRHPRQAGRLAAVVELDGGEAVATSGGYERGDHVVDPWTGRPPASVLSVTVVGPELGTADAYATAAFAMGPDGPAWTAALDPPYGAMTILAGGRVRATPGFTRRCPGGTVTASLATSRR